MRPSCGIAWRFKNYQALVPAADATLPTKATLQHFVIALRERGIKPVTCNTYVGAMNAFCAWLYQEGHARERVKLAKLRVERRLLTLLDDAQIRALITFKPKTFRQSRVHLGALLILDSGLRVSEMLHLRNGDVDCDNLILKVFGKGQKERLVPFSPELRRRLYRYHQLRAKKGIKSEFLFAGFARGGRNATARRPSICCRTSWGFRDSGGTDSDTRSQPTTSVTVETSFGCRWCWVTRRSRRPNATCISCRMIYPRSINVCRFSDGLADAVPDVPSVPGVPGLGDGCRADLDS